MTPLQVSFTPWSNTKLRAMIKEFSKPRDDPPKFPQEFGVFIGACDSGLPGLYQLMHVAPGLPLSTRKACNTATELLRDSDSSLSTMTGVSFRHANKRRGTLADLRPSRGSPPSAF